MDCVNLFSNRPSQWLGLMVCQNFPQVIIDSFNQILVRNEVRTQREPGSEITTFPVAVPAMLRGVPYPQVVSLQSHGSGELKCEVLIVDRNPVSHAAQHSGEIIT